MRLFSFVHHFGRYIVFAIAVFLLTAAHCFSQPGTVTLGLEYKPIFPLDFLHTGTQTESDQGIQFNLSLNSGFNGGMVIRKSFSKLLSLEVGISYVQRSYTVSIKDTTHSESSQFEIIGYEIPVSLLIYAQTGEKTFVNASLGVSPDMFASDVQSVGENHKTYEVRNATFQPAITANLGLEYRTEESGYFYLGATFHGPFSPIYTSGIFYYLPNGYVSNVIIPMSGNYLTVDLRYFFPPDTRKIKKPGDSDQ